MGINIKNVAVETRIRELATLRGVNLVTAVDEAVEQGIHREKESQRRKKLMADWLMEIAKETGPMMNDGKTSKEIMDELYDPETGLPVRSWTRRQSSQLSRMSQRRGHFPRQ